MKEDKQTTEIEKATEVVGLNERLVMWHHLFDIEVLTANGGKTGKQIATVHPSCTWHVFDSIGDVVESGVEIGMYEAKCAASFSAIRHGLLST